MSYKSQVAPLCRCCGKAIKKETTTVRLSMNKRFYNNDWMGFREITVERMPKSQAELKDYTNLQVVAVRYNNTSPDHHITEFFEWDGVSYIDKHFCSGTCARDFAYIVAETGPEIVTTRYRLAKAKQEA